MEIINERVDDMNFLLMQSDYFGEKLKSVKIFEKILTENGKTNTYVCGRGTKNYSNLTNWFKFNNADYILISSWCYNNWVLKDMLDIISEYAGNSIVIIGGWFPNLLGVKALNFHERIDYISLGDGEPILSDIINGKSPDNIDGLYKKGYNGETVYRIFDKNNEVFIEGESVVPLSGCGGKCKFCSILKNRQNFWKKTLNRVEQEIKFQKESNCTEVYLGYDNVLMNRKNAIEYAKLLKKYDLPFATTGRVDQIDDEFAKILSAYGCVRIDFGIESASERMSRYINKNLSYEEMMKSGKLCQDNCILAFGFVIVNLPTETDEDRMQTLKFIKESDYLLFEINIYKDYVKSEFANSINNFEVLATSKYYQYQLCYGLYNTKDECIKTVAAYRYVVHQATYYIIAKFIRFFTIHDNKQLYDTYWKSIRDATLDTTIEIKREWFKDEQMYKDFNYWWRAKKYDDINKQNIAQNIFKNKYFVRKDILENEGKVIVEEVLEEEIDKVYSLKENKLA